MAVRRRDSSDLLARVAELQRRASMKHFPRAVLLECHSLHRSCFSQTARGIGVTSRAEAWVLSIDVDPEHRGKGIGKVLLDGLIASFDRLVVSQITAIIAHSNGASQDLFQKASFELQSQEEEYFCPGDRQQR